MSFVYTLICFGATIREQDKRFRTQIDIIASEAIKGVVYFEIGDQVWGSSSSGADLGTDGIVVEVRRSYIDWTPNNDIKVRMGLQGVLLPTATAPGSLLFGEDCAALVASYSFNDNIAVTGLWIRPYDGYIDSNGNESNEGDDVMDVFGLIVPMTFEGHEFNPYLVYSSIGADSTYGQILGAKYEAQTALSSKADVFWGGFAYSLTAFNPFRLDVDFVYGTLDSAGFDQDGFMSIAKASYALDYMTPAILAWYGSGDSHEGDHGALPVVEKSALWQGTSIGYRAASLAVYDRQIGKAPNGSWALGLEFADISFMDDLSHVFRVVYTEGTHDVDAENANYPSDASGTYLTKHDKAWEINFDTTYEIYENLSFLVELGYLHIDFAAIEDRKVSKAAVGFIYNF